MFSLSFPFYASGSYFDIVWIEVGALALASPQWLKDYFNSKFFSGFESFRIPYNFSRHNYNFM